MKILPYAFECLYSRAKYVSIYQAHSVLCFISTVSSSTTIRLLPQSFLLFSCVPIFTFSTLFLNMLTYEMCVSLSLFFFSLSQISICVLIYLSICLSVCLIYVRVCKVCLCIHLSLFKPIVKHFWSLKPVWTLYIPLTFKVTRPCSERENGTIIYPYTTLSNLAQ